MQHVCKLQLLTLTEDNNISRLEIDVFGASSHPNTVMNVRRSRYYRRRTDNARQNNSIGCWIFHTHYKLETVKIRALIASLSSINQRL